MLCSESIQNGKDTLGKRVEHFFLSLLEIKLFVIQFSADFNKHH